MKNQVIQKRSWCSGCSPGIVVMVLVVAVLSSTGQAAEQLVFWDDISGYAAGPGIQYPDLNPAVVLSQYNGGGASLSSTIGPYSVTPPDQMASFNSGAYSAWTTFAVNSSQSARYGQVIIRMGRDGGDTASGDWMRISVNGAANPAYPNLEGSYADEGPALLWHVGGDIRYRNNTGMYVAATNPEDVLFNITINYDLDLDVYEVWLDNTKIVSSTSFENALTTIESISIGSAWWAAGNYQVLDAWQWKVSDTDAYDSYGTLEAEPQADINVLFQDKIQHYAIVSPAFHYPDLNAAVEYTQHPGGGAWPASSSGPFDVNDPDRFIGMTSGVHSQFTTVAVPISDNSRFGQIMLRVGKDGSDWMRFTLGGDDTPQFPSLEGADPNGGAEIIWHPGGEIKYRTSGGMNYSGAFPPEDEFHEVTINYDLEQDTYQLWVDQNMVSDGYEGFVNVLSTVESISIGTAWWASGNTQVLDYWHWIASDTTPFTSYGVEPNVQVVVVEPNNTTVFSDLIRGYAPGTYESQNSAVIKTQEYGGGSGIRTTNGPFSTTLPDQMVNLASGNLGVYSTFAVNSSESSRYGQVVFRVGKQGGDFMRVSVNGVADPFYVGEPGFPAPETKNLDAAADVYWHVGGYFRYFTNGTGSNLHSGFMYPQVPAGVLYNITINYDLDDDMYEVWMDDIKIIGPTAFSYAQSSIESISIGAAYWSAGNYQVLDAWQWKVSDDGPFTMYGVLPEPPEANEPNSTVVFYDKIKGYNPTWYAPQNPAVVASQYNGGSLSVVDDANAGPFAAIPPNQLVNISSGVYTQYSTLAVNSSESSRYGQVVLRVGKEGNDWMRVSVNGVADPCYLSLEGSYAGAGPSMVWEPGGNLKYRSGASYLVATAYPQTPAGVLYYITINYDLEDDTYEVWLDDAMIITGAAFENAQTTIESISIGAAWWAADNHQVLEYWHWRVSDEGPFTSYGVEVNACGEDGIYLEGDINEDCYVDGKDMAELASQWLKCTDPANPMDCP